MYQRTSDAVVDVTFQTSTRRLCPTIAVVLTPASEQCVETAPYVGPNALPPLNMYCLPTSSCPSVGVVSQGWTSTCVSKSGMRILGQGQGHQKPRDGAEVFPALRDTSDPAD